MHHVYSTLKRHENGRFHVISTCNTRGLFVGYVAVFANATFSDDITRFWTIP